MDLRKQHGAFSMLRDPNLRDPFLRDLNKLVQEAPLTIIAPAVKKQALVADRSKIEHVYHLAMRLALGALSCFMKEHTGAVILLRHGP